MSTYLLLSGAGGESWYWHRVAPLLRACGHEVVAPDLPAADDDAGLAEYADVAVAAAGGRGPVVLVCQSLGAFLAPLVCTRLDVELIVLVAPMIPAPGETPSEWFALLPPSDEPWDELRIFFHDVPDDVVAEALRRGEPEQSSRPMRDRLPDRPWPDVPTRVIAGRHDRFLPLELAERLARERLGVVADVLDTGHLPALADAEALVQRLEHYRAVFGAKAAA
jgi:pimeloyl-ACP methyl ester carboxylesterase